MRFLGFFLACVCCAGEIVYAGELPVVNIPKAEEKPVIDGRLTDAAWLDVVRSTGGVFAGWKDRFGSRLINNQRIAFVCYDDDALYIGVKAYVENAGSLIPSVENKGFSWQDDTVEVHMENTDGEYFQVAVNCRGVLGRWPEFQSVRFKSASRVGGNFWSAEFEIPWTEVDMQPKKGERIRFNLAGHDYLDKWTTWGPVYGHFRKPLEFGYIQFE